MLLASGPCVICLEIFTFNPDRVPSFRGRPICRPCVEAANVERALIGQNPIIIYDDSYEAAP